MPTYDYQCESCAHHWEQEQRMVDDDIKKCQKCKKNKAKKQISLGSGFVLKGAGWYKDLYHKPSTPPPATESETSPVSAPSTSETVKTEAKSEATADKAETKKPKKAKA